MKKMTASTGLRLIALVLTALVAQQASSQQIMPAAFSGTKKINYVRTWETVRPEAVSANLNTANPLALSRMITQYVDGLGRPIEAVSKRGSLITGGTAMDMVSPQVYDEFGREKFQYLPFAANNTGGNASLSDGLFKLNPFQQDSSFSKAQYPGETWYYGQSNFEPSPLSRVFETFAPGNSWVGSSGQALEANRRSVKAKYWFNTITDSVRIWTVTDVGGSFGTYATSASYTAGMLDKMVTVDEHGKQVVEFKDKEGLVILKKVQFTGADDSGTGKGYHGWICTYYIYDQFNRLRCVVQPRGVELLIANSWSMTALSNAILNEQSFRYEYDTRGRMVMKKVPGAGEVYMVYDARDRVVLTQDANLRAGSPIKWLYTQYDDLNRPVATGNWDNNSSLATHAAAAAGSIAYPSLVSQTYEELTRTFYDDYSWRSSYGNPLSATYNTSYDTYFLSASNVNWPYAQANAQSAQLKGLVTGSRVKVLGTASTYLYTVNFYDAEAQVIQVQSTNITGSTDISSTQYSWNNQPLVTIQKEEKANPNTQTIIAVSKMSYDSLWRVAKIEKKISHSQVQSGTMPTNWTTIVENEYDALGQLRRKKLEPGYGGGSVPLDSLSYDYNIRGWMLGMNRLYAKDIHQANYFGFDLGYDKATNGIIGNQSYTTPQYNGNIEGMVWKSKGDGEKRKYDFTYDAANRILSADFNQYTGSVFNKSALVDFSMSGMSYDANGNILSMKQRGLKLTSSVTIDSLSYNYVSYSNKLLNVIDGVNDATTKLGDFRTSTLHPNSGAKNSATTDYSYDVNGNMIKDLNKDMITNAGADGIEYNHLNLPKKINVKKSGADKGYIEYTYDAAGNKLKKTTYEAGVATTVTLYLGGSVFRNDTLEFVAHEEGRARKKGTALMVYDYMLKDHLGNIRMLLTDERDTSFYPVASLETANLVTERLLYAGVDTGRVNKSTVSGYPSDTYTSPNDFIQKLNGNGPRIGTNMVLRVMAGDKFNVFVKSWYKKNGVTPGTPVNPLTSLLSVLNPAVGGITSTHGGATLSELTTNSILNPAATSFLNSQSGYTTSKPKAFINWVLFDEQFKYVAASSNFEQVGADNTLTTHTFSNLIVSKTGYLYIYVSNETPNVDVFFDNLTVTHVRGPVLEETHYYPFGLTMAGISNKAVSFGSPENKKNKFQDQEFNEDFDVDYYEFRYRNHDPQIGRFIQIDPLADKYLYNSTYAFSENKVTNDIELEGLESVPVPMVQSSKQQHHTKNENTIALNRSTVLNSSNTSYSEDKLVNGKIGDVISVLTDGGAGTINFTKSVTEKTHTTSSEIYEFEGVGKFLASTSKSTETNVGIGLNNNIESISETTTTNVSYTKIISEDVKENKIVLSLEGKDNFADAPTSKTVNLKVEDRMSATLAKFSSTLEKKVIAAVNSNAQKVKNAAKAVDKSIKDVAK